MKEFTYTVEDPNGIHARPAGKLATFAKQFVSQIRVLGNGTEADAKRLLSLMRLGATRGALLTFRIEGDDEDAAASALESFCTTQWGDGSGL
ncbi:MAG: HPr family phosphocarrier protein [Clostridia bacterium]|nr:HPr family phosphocarrier protein [Clostridia bacterium]